MMTTEIETVGLYALKVDLHLKHKVFSTTHLFLVGIPITKMLVIFSVFVFALIIGIALVSRHKQQADS